MEYCPGVSNKQLPRGQGPREPMGFYTVILTSNRAGEPLRFGISSSWLKAISGLCFLFLLLAASALADYIGLRSTWHEHEVLAAENLSLKNQAETFMGRIESSASEIQKYKQLIEKLKIITNPVNNSYAQEAVPGSSTNLPAGAPSGREPSALGNSQNEPLISMANRMLQESQKWEQEMLLMWDTLSEQQNFLKATPTIKPAPGYYSSSFGFRNDPINGRPLLHAGVDIAAPYGAQVMAPADGVISYAGFENGYGNLVSIDHGYGVITRYGHNSRIFVSIGQRVHRRDVISAVGSTGHSTGSHLHYEVILHGIPVDPLHYILQEN
jgi:murein DD-endopeptidase MepM/ murein hydrolase activator NlpD